MRNNAQMGESVSSVFFYQNRNMILPCIYVQQLHLFVQINCYKKTVVARGVEDVGHSAGGGLWQDGGDES